VVLLVAIGWILSWFIDWAILTANFTANDRQRMPRRRRLLGADPRKVPPDLLRHLPLRAEWRPLFAVVAMLAMLILRRRPAHVELAPAGDLGRRLVHHLPA